MRRRIRAAVAVLAALAYARLLWVAIAAHVTGGARRHHVEAAWFLLAAVSIVAALVARDEPQQPTDSRPVRRRLVPLVLLGAALALYWPALGVGLLSDDFVLLAKPLFGAWEFVRPVPMLLWKGVHPIGGAAGLHLLNVALHALNGALLWRFAGQIGCGPPGRWIAALYFLTFPAAVEPVVWSSGIFDVLLVTLTLGAVLLAQSASRSRRVLAILLVAAALFTKETAVGMPLLLALAAIATGRRALHATAVLSAVCVAAYVAYRLLAMPAGSPTGFARFEGYVLKELAGRPFASLVLPWTRAEIVRHPILLAVVPQLAIGALIVLYALRHRAARLLPLVLWVFASVLPLFGYLYVGESLEGSRYLYLPLVGWALVIARLMEVPAAVAPRLTHAAVAIVIALHAIGVRAHLAPWQEAASVRDRVLAAARSAHAEAGCSASTFADVPDAVDGVYVFRNGFREAMGTRIVGGTESVPAACAFTWSGDRFVRR